MLANLLNTPGTPQGFHVFSFSNQDEHIKIVRKTFELLHVRLQEYQLDPMPLQDLGGWARVHQQAHDDMNGVLGIAGNDFTTVDFTRPDQLASWIRLHFEAHQQASKILRLT